MEFVDRKEVATVALLALGILLFANPAYTQGQGGSAAEVQVQGIDTDELATQDIATVNPELNFTLFVVEYESLNQQERTMFDTGREGIYVVETEDDLEGVRDFLIRDLQQQVPQVPVLYEGETYVRQVQQGGGSLNFEYTSVDRSYIVNTRFITSRQSRSFRNATEAQGGVNLTAANRGLSAYDYVHDNATGTYYATTTENRRNTTVFYANETYVRDLIDPGVLGTNDMEDETREAVVTAIDGGKPVVTGDVQDTLDQERFVKHDGEYYQLVLGQASPPITEALGPLNFAGMGVGLLFMAGGVLMARRVYKEKT